MNRIWCNLQIGIGALAIVFNMACALYTPSQSTTIIKDCNIPVDQSGTISGKWPALPVPIAFFQGHFNAAETNSLVQAAETWNKFYTASKTFTVLDFGGENPRSASTVNASPGTGGTLCANGIIQNNQFSGNVVIYKIAKWPASYAANAIALTSFCTSPASPFPRMYMAVMEVNYEHFFSAGKKQPDLQSIITHELGHLMGLNHSCEGSPRSGTPNCSDPNLNPDYVTASMFPVFGFDSTGNGEQKRALGVNDQSRANCLY